VRKPCSKFVCLFLICAMTLCFASSVLADGSGTQGSTLSNGAAPPAPPEPTRDYSEWYWSVLFAMMGYYW
jgi:hypothetical protein